MKPPDLRYHSYESRWYPSAFCESEQEPAVCIRRGLSYLYRPGALLMSRALIILHSPENTHKMAELTFKMRRFEGAPPP